MSVGRAALRLSLTWSSGPQPGNAIRPELFILMEAIRETNKLTVATRRAGLSYRQAWGLIAKWSGIIGQPLVKKEQGRGTRLTSFGERLLWLRERIDARLAPHLESAASEVEQQLSDVLDELPPPLRLYASHDLALAELRDLLRTKPGPQIDVRFGGSLDSIVALCKSRCDIAGFHVPEGSFGAKVAASYRSWLKPRLQRAIHFVRRRQGFLVTGNNPKGIRTIEDVVRTKARFINRQRGSGTRLAFDSMLKERGINREGIIGVHSEEFTHLAVAATVASGMADVGLGIEAAARKLRLGFIPLFSEDYYLLVKKEALEQKSTGDLIEVLRSESFRLLVKNIPGYDATEAGTIKTIDEAIPQSATA